MHRRLYRTALDSQHAFSKACSLYLYSTSSNFGLFAGNKSSLAPILFFNIYLIKLPRTFFLSPIFADNPGLTV